MTESIKRCSRCGKTDGPFGNNKTTTDGLSFWCKPCLKTIRPSKEAHTASMRFWRQTAVGRANSAWNRICQRAGNADGQHPAYAKVELRISREAFVAWFIPEIENWLREYPDETPSVDRKDNDGHYEVDNLRIISLSENSRLQPGHKNVHRPIGKVWCGQCNDYLPEDQFYRHQNSTTGYQPRCKHHTRQANIASRRKKKTNIP
jgi:hypothetical protein